MNKLIWKELREMRLIPVAFALLVAMALIACDAVSNWMVAHGEGQSALSPGDCGVFLMFGIALSGIFAGSGAIAAETGSGTLTFLTSLPIGRPHVWFAKVSAGVMTMVASYVVVTTAYLITVSCLFPGGAATKGIFDWNGVGLVSALTAYVYCVALLVSTLVDRTITAAVVAVIAVMAGGSGLGAFFGHFTFEGDPHPIVTGVAIFLTVLVGLLVTSFIAFCRGGSLRTSRRLTIAAVVLSAWFMVGGLGFAAYGRYTQAQWNRSRAVAHLDWQLTMIRPNNMVVGAPAAKGRHWTIFVGNPFIGTIFDANIDINACDLDPPGAIPARADGGNEVRATVGPPVKHVGREYYRGSPLVISLPSDLSQIPLSRRIVPGPTVASVNVIYRPLPPEGPARETVRLYDKRGRIVGTIDIVGGKSNWPNAPGFAVGNGLHASPGWAIGNRARVSEQ